MTTRIVTDANGRKHITNEPLLHLPQQEQDGECKYCTDGCPACDARKLPEQEPVAWLCRRKTGGSLFVYTEEQLHELGYGNISVPPFDKVSPLYTAPPQPEQEPVACKECPLKDLVYDLLGDLKVANLKLSVRAKRTWVGLTDEELSDCMDMSIQKTCRAIEAKLKEKNT